MLDGHVRPRSDQGPRVAGDRPGTSRACPQDGQAGRAGRPGRFAGQVFQTKDLENCLGTYVIKDGRLYERIYEHEEVPEEERPYYGKPEWDEGGLVFGKDFYRRSGSRKIVGNHDEDLEYHGDLVFYATKKDLRLDGEHGAGLATFRARFTEGDLQWIRPYDREEAGPEIQEWRTRRRRGE